jgi:hypothetical protein
MVLSSAWLSAPRSALSPCLVEPGVGVDVVARSALKPRDEHIRAEAVDL